MISPTENEKFAIPLIAPEVSCDAFGNFVPNVLRDSFDRIRNASGLIHGGQLPKGSPPTQVMKEMKGNSKTKYEIVQIIPSIWGGSGCHPDNLNFPSYKQIKTKSTTPSTLDLEIADHLSEQGNMIVFSFDYKYEGTDVFPLKTRRFIDVIHKNGHRMFFRNGAELKLAGSLDS
uniref:Uncharacterized protein n=1 Tax=Panagrolaimus sp. JU765 TaxID=591449 RepID=A0AC34PUS3_9BILA